MSDSIPALSVVIPLYNKRATVLRSVDSVVSQLRNGDEVIIVDDGSTDGGADVVEQRYKGLPFLKLIRQKHQGVSVARNQGARTARHPYVAFLDADDWWLEGVRNKFDILIRRWPCANAWSLGHYRVDRERRVPINSGLHEDVLLSGASFVEHYGRFSGVINSSSVCVKKQSLLELGGFPENITSGEDIYMWLRLALAGSIAVSPEPLVCIDRQLRPDLPMPPGRNRVGFHYVYFSDPNNLINLNNESRLAMRKFLFRNGIRQIAGAVARGDRRSGWQIAWTIRAMIPWFPWFASIFFLLPRPVFVWAFRRRHGIQ